MPDRTTSHTRARAPEANYRVLLDGLPSAVILLDEAGTITDANPAACTLWGTSERELAGRNILELTDPARVLTVNSEWNHFLKEGRRTGKIECRRQDGSLRCLEYQAVAGWIPGRHLVVLRDVTSERAWANRRIDAERELTTLLDNVPALISRYDRDLRFIYTNRRMQEIAGLDPAQVVGKSHAELGFAESDARDWDGWLREVFRTKQVVNNVVYAPNTAGGARWFESQLVPEFAPDGEVESVLAISRDITLRKQVEEARSAIERKLEEVNADLTSSRVQLEKQTSIFRMVLDRMADGVALTDREGNLIFFNPAAMRILGLEHFQVPPEAWAEHFGLYESDDRTRFPSERMPLLRALRGESVDDEEIRIRNPQRPQGVWILVSARALLDASGTMQGAVAIFRDVTRDKIAQQELASASDDLLRKAGQLERSNEDLEHFAYVASHDLKEPLRMVTSYVQLLERRYRNALDEDAREFIGFAVDGARRMTRLLDDLLKYYRSGKQDRPLVDVDCGLLLSNVRENLEPWLRETKAVLAVEPLPIVRGDPGQLRQLFQNLIDNALKYRSPKPPEIRVAASRREGDWLFSVRDNGVGIEHLAKDRLFTIFQRATREADGGAAGIGLAICRRIVTRHGGRIWAEPNAEGGATFLFTLPG